MCLRELKQLKRERLTTIALSGKDGRMLAKEADLTITISSSSTARIQECNIAVRHLLCELTEEALARGKTEEGG